MSKTYFVAIQNKDGEWLTNWGQYFNLEDIDFSKVEETCKEQGYLSYGYYYGVKSRSLTSDRCRTLVKDLRGVKHG